MFVGGLSSTIDGDTLTAAFERFGEVLEVRVIWGKVRPTPLRPNESALPAFALFWGCFGFGSIGHSVSRGKARQCSSSPRPHWAPSCAFDLPSERGCLMVFGVHAR